MAFPGVIEALYWCVPSLFSWNGSVVDTWCEVSFISDIFSCSSWVFWINNWVSWNCYQTTSWIGGRSVVSGLSIAAPEWKRSIFFSNFGLQRGQFHSNHFDCVFLGPDSVLRVFCGVEVIYWCRWLHNSTSLWSGLSVHMFHRVGKQFLALFWLCYCFCGCCCCWLCCLMFKYGRHCCCFRKTLSLSSLFSLFFLARDSDFYTVWVFHIGGTLLRLCRRWYFWRVGPQCFSVARQGRTNPLALVLFLGEWQSFYTCQSPNWPDSLISSSNVTFWHRRIDRWRHMWLSWMRLWPTFEVHQENLLNFDSLDWRQNSGTRVSVSPVEEWAELTGALRSLCIKIGYSEPTRAESREGTSTLAESSRVT